MKKFFMILGVLALLFSTFYLANIQNAAAESFEGYRKKFLRSGCKVNTEEICVVRDYPDIDIVIASY